MDNTGIISLYSVLAFFAFSVIVLTLVKKQRSKLDANLVLIAIALLGWLGFEIACYATTDPFFAQLFYDLKLPFVSWVSLFWLLYVTRFYGVERSLPNAVVVALGVIPLFTLCLAATTTQHGLIRESFQVIELGPMRQLDVTRGPWFWYHAAYCYSLIMIGFITGLVQHNKIPKTHRLPSTLLVVALIISLVANVVVILDLTNVDLSLVGGSITLVFLLLANRNYPGLGFIIEARSHAFQHIGKAVFILGTDSSIVNMNDAAKKWLDELSFSSSQASFKMVLDEVERASVKRTDLADELSGSDYLFGSGVVYNIREKPILNKNKETIGSFVFVSDETDNREIIEYLDKHSGLDALTGLSNRRKQEEDLRELDKEEYYPLAVIFADLNNLKEVNDKHGHHQGDVMLRLAAEALRAINPPNARIGRIGGDEFVVFLPYHNEEQVMRIIEGIRAYLFRESERYPFKTSLALGYAIKRTSDQSINQIINEADADMYRDKQRIKKLDEFR